jgi:sulfite reductase (NADPH) flavoprotein alpha-component
VIDVLLAYPAVKFTPTELVPLLKKLQIRLYSISSSLRACTRQVHLTVATVEYDSHGRHRKGVASTWLAQRLDASMAIPCFINPGKGFRLPAPEEETPVIMVGPGTGIAPFRAFVQERRVTSARGKAWLFFGEQHRASDFFYEAEWQAALADGSLTNLTTAFSRDQAEKFYVQHAMKNEAAGIWAWLEQGAIVYVCGDASRMAADVDRALHEIIASEGGLSAEEAAAYVEALRQSKRYRRDVY